jgi:zinc/manganese transport system substrate-binding protein
MTIRKILGILVLIVVIGGTVSIIISGATKAQTAKGISVVAAENFYGSIAQQLGGKYVTVTSLITNPNADPHLYESSAQDASYVASAKVVILNGVGYDDFMNKLLGAAHSINQQVISAAQILNVTTAGANPHLWYDVPKMTQLARAITASYIVKDPTHKVSYEQNLSRFDRSLQPLLATINQIKQRYSGTNVAYTEPVPGYLLAAAGLTVKTPIGFAKAVEDGDDPSPADTGTMDSLMKNKQVTLLLYNAQTVSPVTQHVKTLAQQAGIPVIGVTETMPTGEPTYQAWQQTQLNELLNALGSQT